MWSKIKAAPGWLWALAVGLVWVLWYLWTDNQAQRRLRVLADERRRIDAEYAMQLSETVKTASAEREVIELRRAGELRAIADKREAVAKAAAGDQQAFVDHWKKVWPR